MNVLETLKYYIVEIGNGTSIANKLGEYENVLDAQEDSFFKMKEYDLLVGFKLDSDVEYKDKHGNKTVKWEDSWNLVIEKSCFRKTDDFMKDIPSGLFFWENDNIDFIEYYYPNGDVWGNVHN